jgi:hypothetical protein
MKALVCTPVLLAGMLAPPEAQNCTCVPLMTAAVGVFPRRRRFWHGSHASSICTPPPYIRRGGTAAGSGGSAVRLARAPARPAWSLMRYEADIGTIGPAGCVALSDCAQFAERASTPFALSGPAPPAAGHFTSSLIVTLKHEAQGVAKAIRWVHDHGRDYGGDPGALIVMGSMNRPIRLRASPRSRNTALSRHSRHSVPQKRSILPKVRGPPRRRHDLLGCRVFQLFGEQALATPGHILTAVIGQDFLGPTVGSGGGA